jgi:single-strand DNA-binding protein
VGRARPGCGKFRRHGGAEPGGEGAAAIIQCWSSDPDGNKARNDMARGVNKVILIGNLGNDPEMKYTQGGMAICTLSLATTSVRKDKDGNQQEKTEWHRVKLFGKLGEIAGEYLKKGRSVYIEGSIRYDKFTGQDGVEKYFTDIVADEMQMLGGGEGQRGGGSEGGGYQQRSGGGGGGYGGGSGGDRQQRAPAQRREPAAAPEKPNFDEVPFDDDIPF